MDILELYIISETKNTLGRYNSGLAQQKIELVNCKIGQQKTLHIESQGEESMEQIALEVCEHMKILSRICSWSLRRENGEFEQVQETKAGQRKIKSYLTHHNMPTVK